MENVKSNSGDSFLQFIVATNLRFLKTFSKNQKTFLMVGERLFLASIEKKIHRGKPMKQIEKNAYLK